MAYFFESSPGLGEFSCGADCSCKQCRSNLAEVYEEDEIPETAPSKAAPKIGAWFGEPPPQPRVSLMPGQLRMPAFETVTGYAPGASLGHPRWGGQLYGQLGQPVLPLPHVSAFVFRNANGARSDPNNCCVLCRRILLNGTQNGTGIILGVGSGGTATNGMELQLTISGHRRGIEYDILRAVRDSLWERRAGVWTRLARLPMGTWDDTHPRDECLIPRGNRIFVIDTPGWDAVPPLPHGTTFPYTDPRTGAVIQTHADATEVVWRLSFAEWVNARSIPEGIPWTRLTLPPLSTGTARPHIYWHSITWLTRNGANQWVLANARSRIALGALTAPVIDTAPVP
jgi:hypothetical protein